MQRFCFGIVLATCLGSATTARRLTFDVHPCAGEVHLALKGVQVVDAAGKALPGAELAGVPAIFLRDGNGETVLGTFEPGCGGGLRLHVPLPVTQSATPRVILRGKLADGTPVIGQQPITPSDYR